MNFTFINFLDKLVQIFIVYMFILLFSKKSRRKKKQSNKSNIPSKKDYYQDDGFYPYYKRKYLLSIPERHFFELLNDIFKDTEYTVFPKVRLWDILEIQNQYKTYYTYQNKIKSKHVDFTICKGIYFEPVLIIELDGSHHWTDANTIYNDKIKNNIFEAVKLPILRIRAKESKYSYDIVELKSEIYSKINLGNKANQ